MKTANWWGIGALACALSAPVFAAENGLQVSALNMPEPWSRVQGRLSLGVHSATLYADPFGFDDAPARLNSLSLLGDYYLTGALGHRSAGGIRATSGVLLGPRATLWGSLPSGGLFQVDRRPGAPDAAGENHTVPYLGVGYTGLSLRGGWGLSVDLGLMALHPRSATQLGGVLTGSQSLDNTLRELRLSPILQLGVSYSF